MKKTIVWSCFTFVLYSASLLAADGNTLKEEIEDLKCRIASVSTSGAQAAAGDADSLTSLKHKGSIKVGGSVNVDTIFKHRDDGSARSENDEVDSTEFKTNSANLRLQVNASKNVYLQIKLDLDDTWDENADQDDILEECKFVFNKVRGTDFDIIFGKGEVPYGQDRSMGIIQSYHHNADQIYSSEGPVMLLGATEENGTPDGNSGNPHANRGNTAHPGEIDNVFMAEARYTWRNKLMFELAVFQNNDTTGGGRTTRGMHEDRSDDTLFFESFAARIWYKPMTNLRLGASFIKMHNDTAGDEDLNGKKAENDRYAASAFFMYKLKNLPLEFFGEYQHGWDWNYTDGYDTDTFQLGMVFKPGGNSSAVDLWLVGEWLSINDDPNNNEEDYLRAILGARYTFENGVFLALEYAHEWWDADYANNRDTDADADVVAFRAGFYF